MDLRDVGLAINQRKKLPLDFCAKENAVYFFEPGQQIRQLGMIDQLAQEFPRKAAASGFEFLQPISIVHLVRHVVDVSRDYTPFALASMGHIFSVCVVASITNL